MPQAAQPQINPSIGATPQPRPVRTTAPTNDPVQGSGSTQRPSPEAANDNAPQKRPSRIDNETAALMISTALLLDIISAIPAVGQLIADVGGAVIFFFWFLKLGLPLISPKKITTYCVSFVISIIPILSILPEITVAIVAFIIITRGEDELGIQVLSSKGLAAPERLTGYMQGVNQQITRSLPSGKSTPQPQQGATPTTQPPTIGEQSPVITSQQEHFADPSVPISQGATPPAPSRPRLVPRRRQINTQDEEVVTGLHPEQDTDSFSPDSYQEDPYSFDSVSGLPTNDNQPLGPRRLPREESVAFPGTSPQFGRGLRQEERDAVSGNKNGKILDFDIRRKEPSPEVLKDTTPTGATPIPKSVNGDVS